MNFETYMDSQKTTEVLPHGVVPLQEGSFDASVLITNDLIPKDIITEKKPNGILFGLGFGGVFGMMDFFEGKKPNEILLLDVTPEAVDSP